MQTEKVFRIGGNPSGGGSIGPADWRWAPLKTVAEYSPQVALARYYKLPFAPFVQSITAQFVNTTDTIGPFSFNNSTDRLSLVSVIDQVVLHVDSPNFNAGNALKPLIDWFFARQTGVQANMNVEGSPRYVVAPNFIPIDTLVAMITESWPMGWILNYTQNVKMQFTTGVPLLAVPTTFTVSFRMWQPTQIPLMVGLTDAKAVELLVEAGVLTVEEAAQFKYL